MSLRVHLFALLALLAVILVPPLHLVAAHGHLQTPAGHASNDQISDTTGSQQDTLCTLCNTLGSALHSLTPVFVPAATVLPHHPVHRVKRDEANRPLDRFCRPPPAAAFAVIAGAAQL